MCAAVSDARRIAFKRARTAGAKPSKRREQQKHKSRGRMDASTATGTESTSGRVSQPHLNWFWASHESGAKTLRSVPNAALVQGSRTGGHAPVLSLFFVRAHRPWAEERLRSPPEDMRSEPRIDLNFMDPRRLAAVVLPSSMTSASRKASRCSSSHRATST